MKTKLILASCALLVVASWSHGQGSFPVKEPTFTQKTEFYKWADGREAPPKDDAFLMQMATFYIHRVHGVKGTPAERAEAIKHLDEEVIQKVVKNAKGTREFTDRFAPMLVERLKEVFTLDIKSSAPSVLHGAQMLPMLARLKHDFDPKDDDTPDKVKKTMAAAKGVGDFLTQLAKDEKQHPAVRLYAIKGLSQFFPTVYLDDPKVGFSNLKKARDLERVETLCKFIEGKMELDKMDEEAARFIRKEAIASLAEVQHPAVATFKAIGKAEGTHVPTLMKVLIGGLTPEARLAEKHQAAIGLCKVKADAVSDYNPEAGIYLVGRFLVEYSTQYNTEVNTKGVPTLPWKIYSEQMKTHLQTLQDNTKNNPSANKLAKQLAEAAGPVLLDMTAGRVLNADFRGNLGATVSGMRPKGGEAQLFKTVKSVTMKVP